MKTSLVMGIVLACLILSGMAAADTMMVVSDATTQWSATGTSWSPAVAAWVHSSWPGITGATWIWRTPQTDGPWEYANVPAGGWYFKKTFNLPACATNIVGTIEADADNAYTIGLNGVVLGGNGAMSRDGPDHQEWNTPKTYTLTGLVAGTNTINARAMNYFNYGPYDANPAGLIFKAEVTYDSDSDCDGVPDDVDKCEDTAKDVISSSQGTNRWIWNGNAWVTVKPKGTGPQKTYSIAETYGCSCTQILDALVAKTGEDFSGHYKYGCSSSVLDDWISGKYPVTEHVETLQVLADTDVPTTSSPTVSGDEYTLTASGTANAGDSIDFDAICSTRLGTPWNTYVSTYEGYGATLLDLMVDGTSAGWGTVCKTNHVYTQKVTGTGNPLSLVIYDIYYPNNDGSLSVDITHKYYVDLW